MGNERSWIMAHLTPTPRFSRRAGIRVAAALMVTGPAAFGTVATLTAQSAAPSADHQAVGAWLAEFGDYQPPATIVFHGDGTGTFDTAGTAYFTTISDLTLPMSGIVIWQPLDETTIDAVVYVAWGDATDDTTMTIRQRWWFDPAADTASAITRMTHMDAEGVIINQASDRFDATRLALVPYDAPATPGASPQATPVT